MTNTAPTRTTIPKPFIAKRWVVLIWIVLLTICVWASRSFFINPLPSDEEFIAHFQKHRADIEELVRRYRQYEPPPRQPHHLWASQGDTPEILSRAGISTVGYVSPTWLPNPYSLETAKYLDADARSGKGYALAHKYGTIRIRYRDPRYERVLLRYMNDGWKDLWFIPEVPRIQNGWLIVPPNANGVFPQGYRVLLSLNDFPPDWRKGDCVLRQIEPQWFIRMCRV